MKSFKQLARVLLVMTFAVLSVVQAGLLRSVSRDSGGEISHGQNLVSRQAGDSTVRTGDPRDGNKYRMGKCIDSAGCKPGGGVGKRQRLVKRQQVGPKFGHSPCGLDPKCHNDGGGIGKRQVLDKREDDESMVRPDQLRATPKYKVKPCYQDPRCNGGGGGISKRQESKRSMHLQGENDIVARDEGEDDTAGNLIKRDTETCEGGCEENQNCATGCIHHRRHGLSDSGALLGRGIADDDSVKDLSLRDIKNVGGRRREACPTGCKETNSCPRRCDPLKKREGLTESHLDAIDRVRSTSSVQGDVSLSRREPSGGSDGGCAWPCGGPGQAACEAECKSHGRREVSKSTMEGKLHQRDDIPCTWPNCGETHHD
jgi:hypothetical protein